LLDQPDAVDDHIGLERGQRPDDFIEVVRINIRSNPRPGFHRETALDPGETPRSRMNDQLRIPRKAPEKYMPQHARAAQNQNRRLLHRATPMGKTINYTLCPSGLSRCAEEKLKSARQKYSAGTRRFYRSEQ
jgi:hypothetical protein